MHRRNPLVRALGLSGPVISRALSRPFDPDQMRPLLLCLLVAACAAPPASSPPAAGEEARIDSVLTAFHDAAGRGDYEAYFGLFAREAVFIGTDDWERWDRPAFEVYARPRFERGGWKYLMNERHIFLAANGQTAWFDEMLQNDGMGTARGSGVLLLEDGDWRITQYNLSLPVPNEIADSVVAQIRAFDAAQAATQAAAQAAASAADPSGGS